MLIQKYINRYTIIIIIVMAALLSIGNYFKRGLQGKWKSAVDGLGDQYDPRFGCTLISHGLTSNAKTTIVALGDAATGWWSSREDISNVTETRNGYMVTGSY